VHGKGVFAPIIEGCPHDFDSDKVKEGNDDSDDEDDTGSALVCCDYAVPLQQICT